MRSWWARRSADKKMYRIFDLETGEAVSNPTFSEKKAIERIENLNDKQRYALVVTEARVFYGVTVSGDEAAD